VFAYFNTNAAGAAYLTLPVSAFEKWLCGILICTVLYAIIFFLFYRTMDYLAVSDYRNHLNKQASDYKELYSAVDLFPFNGRLGLQVYVMLANLMGVAMIGSLYFNKVGLIKTALLFSALVAVVFGLNYLVVYGLFKNVDSATPLNNVFIKVGDDIGMIELPQAQANVVDVVIDFIMPAALWIIAFIRLREKEI